MYLCRIAMVSYHSGTHWCPGHTALNHTCSVIIEIAILSNLLYTLIVEYTCVAATGPTEYPQVHKTTYAMGTTPDVHHTVIM